MTQSVLLNVIVRIFIQTETSPSPVKGVIWRLRAVIHITEIGIQPRHGRPRIQEPASVPGPGPPDCKQAARAPASSGVFFNKVKDSISTSLEKYKKIKQWTKKEVYLYIYIYTYCVYLPRMVVNEIGIKTSIGIFDRNNTHTLFLELNVNYLS